MVYNVIEKDIIEKIVMSSDEYKKDTNKVMGVQGRKNNPLPWKMMGQEKVDPRGLLK